MCVTFCLSVVCLACVFFFRSAMQALVYEHDGTVTISSIFVFYLNRVENLGVGVNTPAFAARLVKNQGKLLASLRRSNENIASENAAFSVFFSSRMSYPNGFQLFKIKHRKFKQSARKIRCERKIERETSDFPFQSDQVSCTHEQ